MNCNECYEFRRGVALLLSVYSYYQQKVALIIAQCSFLLKIKSVVTTWLVRKVVRVIFRNSLGWHLKATSTYLRVPGHGSPPKVLGEVWNLHCLFFWHASTTVCNREYWSSSIRLSVWQAEVRVTVSLVTYAVFRAWISHIYRVMVYFKVVIKLNRIYDVI